MARFEWTEGRLGETTVRVYPHDTTGDPTESEPAAKPWFQAKFSLDLIGGLPFSTDLYKILGLNATLAQPPLPFAETRYGELAGTQNWAATVPEQATKNARLGVFDLYQGSGDAEPGSNKNAVGDEHFSNFWPGFLRINAGLKLEDATISFSDPEIWTN